MKKEEHVEDQKVFYAAGLLPVVCQFGREFFRFAWLLSDKNLNALKTSRYKTFPSRLAMAWRLNHLSLYTLYKKNCCQRQGSNPGPSDPESDALPSEL